MIATIRLTNQIIIYKMKNLLTVLISIALFVISCMPEDNNSEILLKTTGYADSTKIYLADTETLESDSGYIINDQLIFNIDTDEPKKFQLRPVITTRADIDIRTIWKENRQLTIRAEKGNLKNAVVEGSEIQIEADKVKANKDRLQYLNDSLAKAYRSLENRKSEEALALRTRGREITKAITDVDINYVKNNPDNLYSAVILKQLMTYTIPKKETEALYEDLSSEIKSTKYGLAIKKYLEISRDLEVGDKAIDFQLPDQDGNLVGLSNFQGKYILLDFMSSGCGPCRMENPNLLRNYREYRDEGFEIISISFDKNREDWLNAVKKDSMIWTTVCDLQGGDGDVIMTYNVYFMPTYFLINPDGIIIDKFLGMGQLDGRLEKIFSTL